MQISIAILIPQSFVHLREQRDLQNLCIQPLRFGTTRHFMVLHKGNLCNQSYKGLLKFMYIEILGII
jgi:hypothetical protein